MTYYEILQVSENASDEVIRMAYRTLAKKYHPDVFAGDPQIAEAKMKELNEAYAVLSDYQKRQAYDASIHKTVNEPIVNSKNNYKINNSLVQRILSKTKDFVQRIIRGSTKWIPILFIIIGWVLLMVVSDCIDDCSGSDSKLTPVTEPRSGAILSGVEDYDGSEITISASSGESCVVKLKTRSGVTRLSFYVRAGDTVTIGVPPEYLYVYFATGDTWYGTEHLFGKHTDYAMDDEIKNFSEGAWKYTLYPVNNGNFSQTPIDADEFK